MDIAPKRISSNLVFLSYTAHHLQQPPSTLVEGMEQSMQEQQRAHGLGWFSIVLGLGQLLVPNEISRLIGVSQNESLMRALGVRELVTGVGILAQRKPTAGVWARVSGDLMDIGLLLAALSGRKIERHRVAATTGTIVAITFLDLITARRLGQ
jgi:hypothetical protein